MTKHTSVPDWFYTQSAVIPYRQGINGLEILLITSVRRKRWIIPKGVVEPGLSSQESACNEAFEEAGIHGRITGEGTIGSYQYKKWGGTCTVEVFPLLVTEIHDDWPEAGQRERRWIGIDKACELIERDTVCDLIRVFADSYHHMHSE